MHSDPLPATVAKHCGRDCGPHSAGCALSPCLPIAAVLSVATEEGSGDIIAAAAEAPWRLNGGRGKRGSANGDHWSVLGRGADRSVARAREMGSPPPPPPPRLRVRRRHGHRNNPQKRPQKQVVAAVSWTRAPHVQLAVEKPRAAVSDTRPIHHAL